MSCYQSHSQLCSLPVELLLLIGTGLDYARDAANLRATCRKLRDVFSPDEHHFWATWKPDSPAPDPFTHPYNHYVSLSWDITKCLYCYNWQAVFVQKMPSDAQEMYDDFFASYFENEFGKRICYDCLARQTVSHFDARYLDLSTCRKVTVLRSVSGPPLFREEINWDMTTTWLRFEKGPYQEDLYWLPHVRRRMQVHYPGQGYETVLARTQQLRSQQDELISREVQAAIPRALIHCANYINFNFADAIRAQEPSPKAALPAFQLKDDTRDILSQYLSDVRVWDKYRYRMTTCLSEQTSSSSARITDWEIWDAAFNCLCNLGLKPSWYRLGTSSWYLRQLGLEDDQEEPPHAQQQEEEETLDLFGEEERIMSLEDEISRLRCEEEHGCPIYMGELDLRLSFESKAEIVNMRIDL